MKLKLRLLILTCSAILVTLTNAINLPFEVEETLFDLLGMKDISKINMKSVVPIYRKDLNPNYIAYYEIHYRKKFVVLSAGPKTKDYQNVESGPIPSPTQVLVDQARKVGQRCHKFFRLTSMGLYMCENKKSIAVAATFNWIKDAPVTDWKKLQELVQKSLGDFKNGWKEVAASVKDEWKTMQRKKANRRPGISSYDAEIVSPGSTANVALENNAKYISVHAIPKRRQHELCAILEDVCKENNTNVNPKRIHETKNRIRYIRFQVKEDREVVRKILGNKEISFYFRIVKDGQQNLKYFSVDLSSHRHRHWSRWSRWSIKNEYLFPDYYQHKCCGCVSGCGPVAWAQILGYYDRLAHYTTSSGFSSNFWTCQDGSASGTCVAPKSMNSSASIKSDVERYIEGVRNVLGTFCFGITSKGGLTKPSQMKRIINWYRARGIGGQIHSHYVRDLFAPLGITKTSIRNTAAKTVKAGYPVIVGFWLKFLIAHYAVATRYKERQRKYRSCFLFRCRTKTSWQQHFYLHMGWGGRKGNRGWYSFKTFAAYSARKH